MHKNYQRLPWFSGIPLFLGIGIGISIVVISLAFFGCSPGEKGEVSTSSGTYEDLVRLFEEWREFQKPAIVDGVPDYTAEAMAKQHRELKQYQARLMAIDPASWPVSRQVDWHLVRAEGLATGMEEMAMHAGLLDERPRVRELIWIMLACRCARGMGDLKMHSNAFTLKEAVNFGVERTPRGWMLKEGNTIWADEDLYLQQPGYGTSYVVGKVHL